MNELNHCTLPAAQRLVAKGIVLETDCVWVCEFAFDKENWKIITRSQYEANSFFFDKFPVYPAPSPAEVWRELLKNKIFSFQIHPNAFEEAVVTAYEYPVVDGHRTMKTTRFQNVNPADALVDLLIFVLEQKGKEKG